MSGQVMSEPLAESSNSIWDVEEEDIYESHWKISKSSFSNGGIIKFSGNASFGSNHNVASDMFPKGPWTYVGRNHVNINFGDSHSIDIIFVNQFLFIGLIDREPIFIGCRLSN